MSVSDRYVEDCRVLASVAGLALARGRFDEPIWRMLRDALQPFDNLGKWHPERSPQLSDGDLASLLGGTGDADGGCG